MLKMQRYRHQSVALCGHTFQKVLRVFNVIFTAVGSGHYAFSFCHRNHPLFSNVDPVGQPATAGCNPDELMYASLAAASTALPHPEFIHLEETGTAQSSDEGRLRTGRPHRQYPTAPQRRVGGGQLRHAVKPAVALSDHRLRTIVNIKHDGIIVTFGGPHQPDNVGFMEFSPAAVERPASQIDKHSQFHSTMAGTSSATTTRYPHQGCPAPFSPSIPSPNRQSERGGPGMFCQVLKAQLDHGFF